MMPRRSSGPASRPQKWTLTQHVESAQLFAFKMGITAKLSNCANPLRCSVATRRRPFPWYVTFNRVTTALKIRTLCMRHWNSGFHKPWCLLVVILSASSDCKRLYLLFRFNDGWWKGYKPQSCAHFCWYLPPGLFGKGGPSVAKLPIEIDTIHFSIVL